MSATIRILTAEDIDAYVALRREMLEDTPFAFAASPENDGACKPEIVRERLAQGEANVLFGAFAPCLAGALGVVRPHYPKAAHMALIWGMYVQPAHRRRGLGGRLVEAALGHARSMDGVVAAILAVSEKTPGAQALYESFGFEAWGREPRAMHIDGEFADEIHMQLRLDA